MTRREAIEAVIARILEGGRDLDRIKREEGRRFSISAMIKNPEILAHFPPGKLTREIRGLLLKKPAKTASGVTPVAVMIKPQGSCRWGCVFCPFTGLAAKSYTGFEPAALRGRQFGFDSRLQASSRVKQFLGGGHPADKCEVIVMGGTFLETEPEYRHSFIKGIYDGLNGSVSETLEQAKEKNERAAHRVVGLTIETRPDVCTDRIGEMLGYGATRVELGVQHADDAIYEKVNRGHTVKDVVESTSALKNAAFKVLYHIMPGLPGSDPEKDVRAVKKLFEDPSFRPDMLKIYPTLVVGGTILEKWADEGKYSPYSSEEAAEIISEFYRYIPQYVRVMRIQRDIPADKIAQGVKKSNLRELVEQRLREKGIAPKEIRYREIGISSLAGKPKNRPSDLRMSRLEYEASGGTEFFISFEDEEGLIAGFIRLRLPGENPLPLAAGPYGLGTKTALIRELHVYGSEVPLDREGEVQHRGLGSSLLREAEGIAAERGKVKMAIISGVGVREYYRRFGYELEGPYMCRRL